MRTNIGNKVGAALLTAVIFSGCEMQDVQNVSSEAFTGAPLASETISANVALISAWSSAAIYYGSFGGYKGYTVSVRDLGSVKNVVIYGSIVNGVWGDIISLTKEYSTTNGYEIWSAKEQLGYPVTTEFAVRYEVNGAVYWDNNNGRNYTLGVNDGPMLNNSINVDRQFSRFTTYENNRLSIGANVRNIGYNKNVTIVYTTDNWATVRYGSASFSGSYPNYREQYAVKAPNSHGIEPWGFSILLPGVTEVKYAVKYEVNGQVFWDNNFGMNYTVPLTEH